LLPPILGWPVGPATASAVAKQLDPAVTAGLHRIMNAMTLPAVWSAARRFADRWESTYPKVVACRRAELDDPLTCFCYPAFEERKGIRITDEIGRRFPKVRRRTYRVGTFQNETPLERAHPVRRLHARKPQPGPRHPPSP
jgi:transposase-like protein